MNEKKHKEKHKKLHRALDELVADMINHTGKFPAEITVFELIKWAKEQMDNPTTK